MSLSDTSPPTKPKGHAMLNLTSANLIDSTNLMAPEWADTIPGYWAAENVTTPAELKEWHNVRGLTAIRSDDPMLADDYAFKAEPTWRDMYSADHVFVRMTR